MEETPITTVCEQCFAQNFTPVAGDKTDGQLCPECQSKGMIIRIETEPNEEYPRFVAGLSMASAWIDEGGVYGEWYEFSNAEYQGALKEDWFKLADLDDSSFEALQASVEVRSAFLREFWAKHRDTLVARDNAMNEWEQIKAGRPKPIHWLDIPDFKIILTRMS
jgi:hypothetical protein